MNFIYILILILLVNSSLVSKTIFFEDIVLERSKTINLPIQIDEPISENYPINLEIELIFNAYMFEIESIEDIIPMNATTYEVELNIDDLSRSKLIINSELNEFNNILFIINLTGLASKDSISEMELERIEINDEIAGDVEFNSGTFRINNLVFNLESSLSEIYPNPILSNSFIDLNIRQESVLKYKIFDLNGKNLDYQISNEKFDVSIYNSNNEKLEFENETILDVGEYKMEIYPNRIFTAMGTYRIVISINEKTYYKNFIYGG